MQKFKTLPVKVMLPVARDLTPEVDALKRFMLKFIDGKLWQEHVTGHVYKFHKILNVFTVLFLKFVQ